MMTKRDRSNYFIKKVILIIANRVDDPEPVSISEGEPEDLKPTSRSFSTLKRLKIYIRNTMGQARLNDLALIDIHRN